MKTFAKLFLVAILFTTISSCERQSCSDVACPLGQNCANGRCYCADGLEGTDCASESWSKYTSGTIGGGGSKSWNVVESCSNGYSNFASYTALITHNSSDPKLIDINNFLGGNGTVTGVIRTDQSNQGNIVEINNQNCGGILVNGQGTWDPSYHRITFQLNYTYNFTSYQCTHTFY